jgi:hypothetical protein
MWQLGGLPEGRQRLIVAQIVRPEAAQGPEMSPEMRWPGFARCGNLDLRAQAEVLNALRSDTPE